MKTKSKERRVLNIDKESYDLIKYYCDHFSLKMSNWLPKLAMEHIFTSLQNLSGTHEDVTNSLPEFTTVVKQHIGCPEKFEKYINDLHKKLGIK